MSKIRIEPDAWLKDVLKRPAFRMVIEHPDRPLKPAAARSLAKLKPGFYYAKLPTSAIANAQLLTEHRFYVVDVNMVFERTVVPSPAIPAPAVLVRDVTSLDLQPLLRIAGSSFRYSRFHLDPAIVKRKADEIKRQWIKNCLERKRGDGLFVAESAGKVIGFLATITQRIGGEPVAIIDLIAVAPDSFRHGVGEALVNHFLKTAPTISVRVGTQAANIPSIRLYEKCGFHAQESQFVLHAHIGKK